jgi:lipopolysaccharide/colanic/teichoic acid biosynthesis glycosyltransferase
MLLSRNALPAQVQRKPGAERRDAVPIRAPESLLLAVADFTFAFVLLGITLPLLLLAAALIKLTSRGPIIYRQVRLGKNGRPYMLYKLRTMVTNSEQNGACWSLPGDPRVTPVGRFLRRSHLDELPQLWNVLMGDMNLIGPRPERPEFVPKLEQAIPHYRARLLVRPGLTGLAQVQLPADTDLESVRKKLGYDLWYLQHRNLGLDLRILLATGLKMVGLRPGLLRILFRLPPHEVIEKAHLVLSPGQVAQPNNESPLVSQSEMDQNSSGAFLVPALASESD